MKKLITLLTLFILIGIFTNTAKAEETVVSGSGTIRLGVAKPQFDYRVENLRHYLDRFNSPLTSYSEEFVMYADLYGLDYRLVPAITGVESTFGKHIPYKSYNAYGWANGNYKFLSWEDSIKHVTMTLRNEYINKGAASIAKISRRYAPPSTTWAGKVSYFIGKIDSLPVSYDI
ncbi:MAG: glucosaminidase domain-containing protein [Candidatus Woesebacteria bacterium]|nr:MAG: glucosaminidase domain-containing protein [Candidatus Woesebacteria bacterium]